MSVYDFVKEEVRCDECGAREALPMFKDGDHASDASGCTRPGCGSAAAGAHCLSRMTRRGTGWG
jgi:hypothetical protein